jgi:hypothetical protein
MLAERAAPSIQLLERPPTATKRPIHRKRLFAFRAATASIFLALQGHNNAPAKLLGEGIESCKAMA